MKLEETLLKVAKEVDGMRASSERIKLDRPNGPIARSIKS